MKQNIGAFGGDAARVTVFGVSAGGGLGGALARLACRGRSDRWCHRAERGSPTARWMRDAPRWWRRRVCEAAGVTDVDGLRQLDVDGLLAAQGEGVGRADEAGRHDAVSSVRRRRVGVRCPAAKLGDGAAGGVRLFAGSAAEEMNVFFGMRMPLEPEHRLAQVGRYLRCSAPEAPRK